MIQTDKIVHISTCHGREKNSSQETFAVKSMHILSTDLSVSLLYYVMMIIYIKKSSDHLRILPNVQPVKVNFSLSFILNILQIVAFSSDYTILKF